MLKASSTYGTPPFADSIHEGRGRRRSRRSRSFRPVRVCPLDEITQDSRRDDLADEAADLVIGECLRPSADGESAGLEIKDDIRPSTLRRLDFDRRRVCDNLLGARHGITGLFQNVQLRRVEGERLAAELLRIELFHLCDLLNRSTR